MKDEDLLNEIRTTREVQSRFDKAKKDVPKWYVFWIQFIQAIDQILLTYVPFMRKIWVRLFRWYRAVWAFCVYKRNDQRELVFSKPRAGIFLVGSVLFLLYGLIPTFWFAADAAIFTLTVKTDEVLYLHNSQEIDPNENIHSVQGNYALPLDEDDTVYFLVEDTWFNSLWSILVKGGLFYPDYISATVPPGLNKCVVTSYGIRAKTLMRRWELYPYLLSAKCSPVTNEELNAVPK